MSKKKQQPPPRRQLPHIGWREWIAFPDLGIKAVKAKIDTGARTSSIHALHIKPFERDGQQWVKFQVHPIQRDSKTTVDIEAPLLEYRRVTSSTGHASLRPVILAMAKLFDIQWTIELTLTSRDEMGFRMLLGREAFRDRFLIDAGRSYLAGRRKTKRKSKKPAK